MKGVELWKIFTILCLSFRQDLEFGVPQLMAGVLFFSETDEGRPPIKVKFEIPYFTVSGIQVIKS